MILLTFETATEACSVALSIDGEVREHFEIAPRRHAELVLPWADALLVEAGIAKSRLDAIAFGRGPGAFTGVRLAISIAQGIALALDRPVVPISTLAALALQITPDERDEIRILAAIDARMGELYLGAFAHDADSLVTPITEESLTTSETLAIPLGHRWIGVGTGFAAADSALVRALGDTLWHHDAAALPRASAVARLAARAFARGEAVAPERVEPAYLRNKIALTLAERGSRIALRNTAPETRTPPIRDDR